MVRTIVCVSGIVLSLAAQGSLQRGRDLFKVGKYRQAVPDFFEVYGDSSATTDDKIVAEWYLAESLRKLDLFYSSSLFYSRIVKRGWNETNKFFKQAFEELGTVNTLRNLGQTHIAELLKTSTFNQDEVPDSAKGFYFYSKGLEQFDGGKYPEALQYFSKVGTRSNYYVKAAFYLGIIAHLLGRDDEALKMFEESRKRAEADDMRKWMVEQVDLNVARVHYKNRRFVEAINAYARIPRQSDNWLHAIFEASWAFLLMEKGNNALGNIHTLHSPFFVHRFFPESYIVEAVTYLRMCRYDRVSDAMKKFKDRYAPILIEIKRLLEATQENPKLLVKVVYEYRDRNLNKYTEIFEIIDALSRSDVYKQIRDTIVFADEEYEILSGYSNEWSKGGLHDVLRGFLERKKVAAAADGGRRLFKLGVGYYNYLVDLSEQTKLITAELLLGKVEALRQSLDIKSEPKPQNFIGGMQPLVLKQDLEYWPFEGEYWEDELGGYVYNINSKCKK